MKSAEMPGRVSSSIFLVQSDLCNLLNRIGREKSNEVVTTERGAMVAPPAGFWARCASARAQPVPNFPILSFDKLG
jgi:hypothetical protein